MFRRNKNKGKHAGAKFQDDSLLGPGIPSSSSGVSEPNRVLKKGKSGLFRRKKKNNVLGRGNSFASDVSSSAASRPLSSYSAESMNSAAAPTASNIANLSESGLHHPQTRQQYPQESARPQPPQARNVPSRATTTKTTTQLPSKNPIAFSTDDAAAKENNMFHLSAPRRPQQQQRQQRKKQSKRQHPTQRTNDRAHAAETRDEKNRLMSSSHSSLKSVRSDRSGGGVSSGSDAPSSKVLSNLHIVSAASKQPPPEGGGSDVDGIGIGNAAPMMARSGWSVASNASSAVNSEHYIRSLDNLPPPPPPPTKIRSGTEFPMLGVQPDDRTRGLADDRTRAALSRQFGRDHLPPRAFSPKWLVGVAPPRWHADERRHKYKIDIAANDDNDDDDPSRSYSRNRGEDHYDGRSAATGSFGTNDAGSYSRMSFASTAARRSLQDFVWLEQALRAEYQGALVVPVLSLALYFGACASSSEGGGDGARGEDESLATRSLAATDATSKGYTVNSLLGDNGASAVTQSYKYIEEIMERNEVVDESLLANWLSDVINGIRGNGEVMLHSSVDMMQSEAMETFLYRHSETTAGTMGANQKASNLGSPFNLFSIKNRCQDKTLFEDLVENQFACFNMDNVCGSENKTKRQDSNRGMNLKMMCSSGRTGAPGIENCNSYMSQSEADFDFVSLAGPPPRGIATHSELLEAEKDLIASYIQSSSLALTKVQSLAKDESYVGQCWKRFAISLSNLFSVEKDLEQAHIGDQIKLNKKNQPFRKLRKSAVDDALRMLARGKIDRSNPSLTTLRTMMNAYFADLNSVVPALREYFEAVNQLHQLEEAQSLKSNRAKTSSTQIPENNEWPSSLHQLKALTWGVTQQITGVGTVVSNDSESTADDEVTNLGSLSTTQTQAFQSRLMSNEKTLKVAINLLCRASPLRNARMAWWYLKTEAKQALKVHTAASGLRQKLSIDADAASAMKARRYDADETKDNEAELKLVTRILDLVSPEDRGDMFDNDAIRQNAIAIATEQVGRWNAKTALALMEAAGVADAEVQIDETSRELRHVRKYAISLRENVARCLGSAEALASSFILNSEGAVQIGRSRREFWAAVSVVFSGKIIPAGSSSNVPTLRTPSTRVLASVGIDVTDRGGWLGHNASFNNSNQKRRNCGEAARQYLKKRDNQANILISRIVKLLKDYERRLEGIESFVYMHCVGIQLEKHCSRARSKALSAWEKRTDISTAINVATKKKIPKLVQELKVKLNALPQVSHTTVLKRKEEHLASKALKSDLHKLANRRFGRAQEVSTERVIAVMSLWAKHEESVAMEEVKTLGEAVQEVELSVQSADVDAVLDRC